MIKELTLHNFECFTAPAIYLWALILKIVVLGWLIKNSPIMDNTPN